MAIMMTERVRRAMDATKKYLPDYWAKMLIQRAERSGQAMGSVYERLMPEDVELVLGVVEWSSYEHPEIASDCIAATAEIHGRLGLVKLAEIPEDAEVHLLDPKGTGKVSAVVKGIRGPSVDFTVLIMGTEKVGDAEVEVVYTFHPGEPVRPSLIEAAEYANKVVTPAHAIALGFSLAKVE